MKYLKITLQITIITIITLILLEGLLQVTFNNLPETITQRMPQAPVRYGIRFNTPHGAREYPANQVVNLTIDRFAGDLYSVSCLSSAASPNFEPYAVNYTRDDHGFRNSVPWPQNAQIVMLGDSFTAAENIQRPFWQNLSPSIVSFGLPGSGGLEQQLLLEAFGFALSPELIIMAYFGGNDLQDNWRFYQAREAGETLYAAANRNRKPWEYLVTFQIIMFLRDILIARTTDCPYPVQDQNGVELAFFDDFIRNNTASIDLLRNSEIFNITRETILSVSRKSKQQGITFLLVYLPFKAQVYWELLNSDTKKKILGNLSAAFSENMDAQRILLAELAAENEFLFLDLTPAFQEAAKEGINTFFYSDTHWNQDGHDLANKTIRRFLAEHGLIQN